MFDSQKLSFQNWLLGYKHGVYVFVSDSCEICNDYKKELEFINNCYLYIVEVSTNKEKEILSKLIDRTAFPATVAYKDNQIEFIKMGMLFDTQMHEILDYLKPFGEKPLSDYEIQQRIEKQKNRCILSYYVFPNDATEEEKQQWMVKAEEYNELPIDIETVGIGLPNDKRERMLEGSYHFCKLIVFTSETEFSNYTYSEFQNSIIIGYSLKNKDVKFQKRKLR